MVLSSGTTRLASRQWPSCRLVMKSTDFVSQQFFSNCCYLKKVIRYRDQHKYEEVRNHRGRTKVVGLPSSGHWVRAPWSTIGVTNPSSQGIMILPRREDDGSSRPGTTTTTSRCNNHNTLVVVTFFPSRLFCCYIFWTKANAFCRLSQFTHNHARSDKCSHSLLTSGNSNDKNVGHPSTLI